MGERDQAFEWLNRAYNERDPRLAGLKMNPLLGNLHSDSRWPAFLEKMGLGDLSLSTQGSPRSFFESRIRFLSAKSIFLNSRALQPGV